MTNQSEVLVICVGEELKEDDGSTLVCQMLDGSYRRTFAAYNIENDPPPGYKKVSAIRIIIEGRVNKIFIELSSEITPLIRRKASSIV